MQGVATFNWVMTAPGLAQPRERGGKEAASPAARRIVTRAGGRGDGADADSGRPTRYDGSRCVAAAMDTAPMDAPVAGRERLAGDSRRGAGWVAGCTEGRALESDGAEIVRRSMDGDSGAWAEMVRAHQKRVYGLCYRFTGNAADAEDLTQDVFLKIYMNLASFDAARGSLPVWITTMTRNLLVDNFRRTRNQRATRSLDEGWEQTEELRPRLNAGDRLAATGPSPHEAAARNELKKMVEKALMKVSADLREAVILRDLQDLDYKEIAQVLGIPEGTVKSRISRGRAELARLLERTRKEVM